MWNEELEQAAALGQPVPEGLGSPERALYILMRSLYHQHRVGIIDLHQAKREKRLLMQDYENTLFDEKCRRKTVELWKRLPTDALKCSCPECQKIQRIILGLDKME